MKKLSLYIFLVLMWCNVGFAGWFSKELYINCHYTEEDSGYLMVDIKSKDICISDEKGNDRLCGKVAKFNSDIVKSQTLEKVSDTLGQKVYWKVDRKTSIAGFYSILGDKLLSEKLICKTREKL